MCFSGGRGGGPGWTGGGRERVILCSLDFKFEGTSSAAATSTATASVEFSVARDDSANSSLSCDPLATRRVEVFVEACDGGLDDDLDGDDDDDDASTELLGAWTAAASPLQARADVSQFVGVRSRWEHT